MPGSILRPRAAEPDEISRRLESLPASSYLWRLVILLSLGGCFEIYDLFFTGYIAPGLTRSGLLTTTTQAFFGFSGIGAFVAATFAGLFVGTFFLGFLADRFGRRAIFTFALLGYTAASVVMACQTTSDGLLLWRFIAGIGIGVEIITIDAYITELVPSWMRGRAFAVNQAVMFIAVPVVAFLSWWLVPLSPYGVDGWRWVVLIGAAGSMVIWMLRLFVPESPLWLARHGRTEEADKILATLEAAAGAAPARPHSRAPLRAARARWRKSAFADLFKPPYLSLVVLFMVFNFCQAFGFYGFANWVPTLLVEKGITVTKSLQYSFIVAFAYPIAPLLAASFADRFERKWIICGACVGDHRVRHGVLAIHRARAADPVRRAAHGGEHDHVLRLSCLSDRGVSDRDPRAGLGSGLFDEPGQRDVLRLHRRLHAARGRRRRRVRPDHRGDGHRHHRDRDLRPERARQAAGCGLARSGDKAQFSRQALPPDRAAGVGSPGFFPRAAGSVNQAARSISGNACNRPLFGGHSISNVLLFTVRTSRSPSAAKA